MPGDSEQAGPDRALTLEERDSGDLARWKPVADTLGQFIDLYEQMGRMLMERMKSLFFCTQAVGAQMIRQIPEGAQGVDGAERSNGKMSNGRIVSFSSISGRHGRIDQAVHAATKAAVISITQSAALAFASCSVNVNAAAPSVVTTAMWEQVERERGRIAGASPGSAMKHLLERIPLGRAGAPEEMAAAVSFLCGPESDYTTGQVLNGDGGFDRDQGQVLVVVPSQVPTFSPLRSSSLNQ